MAEEKKPTSKVAETSTSRLPDHELCPVPSVLVRPEAAQMAEPNRRHQLPGVQPGGPDVLPFSVNTTVCHCSAPPEGVTWLLFACPE